jgi:RNA polymerase sigma factor (sigma-70 family)
MDSETGTGVEEAELLWLWRRCAAAPEEREWAALFEKLDARLQRLVRRQLRRIGDDSPCREDVEEVAQEVYFRLLRNDRRALRGCRARSAGELWCYLDRMCVSVVVDGHRSRNALKRRGPVGEAERQGLPSGPTTLDDPEWCPEERLLLARAREHIFATCRSLASCPDRARRNAFIVESVVFEGRSVDEVAARVGMRRSGVHSVLARLRRRLAGAGGDLAPGVARLSRWAPAAAVEPGSAP